MICIKDSGQLSASKRCEDASGNSKCCPHDRSG
jgi:hypothetical protein